MVRITEDLVRKRAEHNELEICSLEEVSLHQQDIERIEHIDKWCRELKILYLQSNLIPKIENVGRLKKLEYLNLALNNVERIENLEGCESLKKLDLTINFVGELTSVDELAPLYSLEELFLTGNPCTEYDGYRDYVVATLPQLKRLDGTEVNKSERIIALQNYPFLRNRILEQQNAWFDKRAQERKDFDERKANRQSEQKLAGNSADYNPEDDPFWNEKTPFTPEFRVETHEHMKEVKRKEEEKTEKKPKPPRRLFADDGRPFNVNESGVTFTLEEEEKENQYILDVAVYKYMDTSLIDCDVQPNYVRIKLKDKILQLALPDEVKSDSSNAARSQITGHLVVTMPKVKEVLKPQFLKSADNNLSQASNETKQHKENQFLEVGGGSGSTKAPDWRSIVPGEGDTKSLNPANSYLHRRPPGKQVQERPNSPGFVDDPDVPPLI